MWDHLKRGSLSVERPTKMMKKKKQLQRKKFGHESHRSLIAAQGFRQY
jgi:hypothetical protein